MAPAAKKAKKSSKSKAADEEVPRLGIYPGIALPPPSMTFDWMVDGMREWNAEKFGSFLDDDSNLARVKSWLRPEVEDLFKQAWDSQVPFTLHDFKQVGGETKVMIAGTYVHCLESVEADQLYVGQSVKLRRRIHRQHMDPEYRKGEEVAKSPHYQAWDKSSHIASSWIVCGTVEPYDHKTDRDRLGLQVFEMWMAVSFQSLLPGLLDRYLPAGTPRVTPVHLNVQSPLAQGDQKLDISVWKMMRWSADPEQAEYARKILSDLGTRGAARTWLTVVKQASDKIYAEKGAWAYSSDKEQKNRAIDLQVLRHRFRFSMTDVDLDGVDKIELSFDFVGPGERHPHCYATKAETSDPASTMAVRVYPDLHEGDATRQRPRWLSAGSLAQLFSANSLIDKLNGSTMDEIKQRPRRKVYVEGSKSRKQTYTSPVK